MSHDVEAGVASSVVGALITVAWAPWSEESKKRRRRKRIMKIYIDGQDGEDGLLETVLSAPIRMMNCERDIGELQGTYEKIKNGNEFAISETKHLRGEVETLTGLIKELLRLWNPTISFSDAVKWEGNETQSKA